MKSTFFPTLALVTMAVAAPITPGEKRELPGANLIGGVTNILPVSSLSGIIPSIAKRDLPGADLIGQVTKILPVGGSSGGILSSLTGKRDLPGANLFSEVTKILPVGGSKSGIIPNIAGKRDLPGGDLLNEVTEILPVGSEEKRGFGDDSDLTGFLSKIPVGGGEGGKPINNGKRDLPGADLIGEVTKILPVGSSEGGIIPNVAGKGSLPGANFINQITEVLPLGGKEKR